MSLWGRITETPARAVLSTLGFNTLTIALFYTYFLIPESKRIEPVKLYRASILLTMTLIAWSIVWNHFDLLHVGDSLTAVWCTVILFAGPILQKVLNEIYWYKKKKARAKTDPKKYVNQVIKTNTHYLVLLAVYVASFEEEMVYRVFACGAWEAAGIGKLKVIFLSPLMFGISHFHFFFWKNKKGQRPPLLGCLVQVGYTTLFGWYAAFVWVRYHSFIGCALTHAFCNFMGFPDFYQAWKWRDPVQKIFVWILYLAGLIGFIGGIGYMATT